jgi:hypothetical protein
VLDLGYFTLIHAQRVGESGLRHSARFPDFFQRH